MRVTKPSFFQKKLGKSRFTFFYLSLYSVNVVKPLSYFIFIFYILFRFCFVSLTFNEFSNYFIMHNEKITVVRFLCL